FLRQDPGLWLQRRLFTPRFRHVPRAGSDLPNRAASLASLDAESLGHTLKAAFLRSWRNWQTHQLEGLAVAIPCRFKPCRPHSVTLDKAALKAARRALSSRRAHCRQFALNTSRGCRAAIAFHCRPQNFDGAKGHFTRIAAGMNRATSVAGELLPRRGIRQQLVQPLREMLRIFRPVPQPAARRF